MPVEKSQGQRTKKEKLRARKYKNLVEEEFAGEVEMHNWNRVLGCADPSESWHIFLAEFNLILDRHAPWKICTSLRTHQNRLLTKCWLYVKLGII